MNLSLLSWTLFLLAVVTSIFLTAAKRVKAFRFYGAGHVQGKIVITINKD